MSFRLKTILGIALIEVVVLAILIISSLNYLRTSNEQELLRRAEVTAQLLATMTSDAVISNDLATLDALIQQTLKSDGLVYVRIRNTAGLVMSEGGVKTALAEPFIADGTAHNLSDKRLDLAAPIEVSGVKFGLVEIGLSNQVLDTLVAASTKRMLSIAAVEIILVAVFGYFLGSILTRQLARLRSGARRVAAGEFGHQMDVVGKDELADTAKSFNKMSKALLDHANDLKAERDRAEAGRVYAQTLLYDAMNSVSQSIFIINPDGKLEFTNKAAQKMYPINWARVEKNPTFEVLFEEVIPLIESDRSADDIKSERIATLQNRNQRQSWQSRLTDGSTIFHTQRPMSNGGVVVVDMDITELYSTLEKNKRLELELLQAHKLESLGTLASGVAHEINTPAQFIGDNLRFLNDSFDQMHTLISKLKAGDKLDIDTEMSELDWEFLKEEVPAALNEAISGIESIGKIVRSIKEFSHPDDGERQIYDMAKLVETATTVSRPQWRHCAQLLIHCDTNDTTISCYPGDISQVLINLIVNAADAITDNKQGATGEHGGGRIEISLRREKQSLAIDVTDNGGGIPEDIQRSIFDMFFTTKPPGQGTGQGLAISKSIVETKHGGELKIQSIQGKGTTFTIILPIEDQQISYVNQATHLMAS